MSNESFSYPDPYPAALTHGPPSASTKQRYASTDVPSTAQNPQATAPAASSYGNSGYQSHRYDQQGVSNSETGFDWYSNLSSRTVGSQGSGGMGDIDIPQRVPDGLPNFGPESIYQQVHNTAGLAALTHASSLEYNSNQNARHRGGNISSNGYGSIVNSEGGSGQMQYQGVTSQNYEHTRTACNDPVSFNSIGTQHQRRVPVDQTGQRVGSSSPPIPSATYSQTQSNTYNMNTAVARSNSVTTAQNSDSTGSLLHSVPQTQYASQSSFGLANPSSSQALQDQIGLQITAPPSSLSWSSQAPIGSGDRRKDEQRAAPPTPAQFLNNAAPKSNVIQLNRRNQGNLTSVPASGTESSTRPKPRKQRQNKTQTKQYHKTPSVVFDSLKSSVSAYTAQVQQKESSEEPQQSEKPQRSNSPVRLTTVNPSHVYNRYHEYQEQIEAADTEHARLAALKAEREAVERAVAAVKIVSQSKGAQASPESGNDSEVGKMSEESAARASESANKLAAINQSIPKSYGDAVSMQKVTRNTGDSQTAVMEMEMRIMVEKMREYQTQNPNLFQQVWESMRRGTLRPNQSPPKTLDETSILAQGSANEPSQCSVSTVPKKAPLQRERNSKAGHAGKEQVISIAEDQSVANCGSVSNIRSPSATTRQQMGVHQLSPTVARMPKQPDLESLSMTNKPGLLGPPSTSALVQNAEDTANTPRNMSSNSTLLRQLATSFPSPVPTAYDTLQKQPTPTPSPDPTANSALQKQPLSAPVTVSPSPSKIQSKQAALWPESQRDIFASTAAKVLNAIPENVNKSISPLQIRGILDCNPSYTELCTIIDGLGFKIDREIFARALLAAIPNANATAQVAPSKVARPSHLNPLNRNPSTPRAPASNSIPSSVPAKITAGQFRKPEQTRAVSGTNASAENPQITPVVTNTAARSLPVYSQTPRVDSAVMMFRDPKTPTSFSNRGQVNTLSTESGKARSGSLARGSTARDKSSGYSLNPAPRSKVDTTQTPLPLTKETAARKRTFAEIIDLTVDDDETEIHKAGRVGDVNPQNPVEYSTPQSLGMPSTTATNTRLPHDQIRLNTPSSPQTNLIVPGNAPSNLKIDERIVNPFKGFKDIVKPVDKSLALRKSQYDSKTIARDILIASSRHPSQRPLNAHLDGLKTRFKKVDDFADLYTFRWDIVDPGGLPVGSANMPPPEKSFPKTPQDVPLHEPAIERTSAANKPQGISLSIRRSPLRPTRGGPAILGPRGASRKSLLTRSPVPPSGLLRASFMDRQPMVIIDSSPSDGSRPGKNDSDATDTSTPSRRSGRLGETAADEGEKLDSLPRRVERQPKNASDMSTPEPPLKRGPRQPPRSVTGIEPSAKRQKADEKVSTLKFIPFLCEWRDCKAELQNLDTLRRHLFTVHNKVLPSNRIACQWAQCEDPRDKFASPRNAHHNFEFETLGEFREHVQKAHLNPFAWHMGDGPRGTTLDEGESDESQYLMDASGQEITPSVASQLVEGGSAKSNNAKRLAREKQKYHPALEAPEAIVPLGAYPMREGKMTFIDRPTAERPYYFEKCSKRKN